MPPGGPFLTSSPLGMLADQVLRLSSGGKLPRNARTGGGDLKMDLSCTHKSHAKLADGESQERSDNRESHRER